MPKNCPNLGKETDIQIQEAQKVSKKMNPKKPTPRYILIKLSNVKDTKSILKTTGEKELVSHKGILVRPSAYFSAETLEARRGWQNILKVPRSGGTANQEYSTWQSCLNGRRNKEFSRKGKAEGVYHH